MRQRFVGWLGLSFVGIVVTAWYLTTREEKAHKVEQGATASKVRPITEPRPRVQLSEKQLEQKQISEPCLEFFNQMRALDLADFSVRHRAVDLPSPQTCSGSNETEKKRIADYQRDCKDLPDPARTPEEKKRVETCLGSLFFVRALIGNRLTSHLNAKEINDLASLADRIFALFVRDNSFRSDDVKKLEEAAERMAELAPHLYGAAKISFLASREKFLGPEATSSLSEQQWEILEDKAKRLNQMGVTDPELEEIEIWVRSRDFDTDKMKDLLTRHQFSPIVQQYYEAYVANREGNREEAQRLLAEGAKQFPNSTRFKETLDSCKNNCNFRFNYSFSFNFEDFEKK